MAAGAGGAVLRPARVGDSARIAAFHTACWRDAYRGIVPDDYLERVGVDERARSWTRRMASGARAVVLAESGKRRPGRDPCLVGIVSTRLSHDPTERDVPTLELASLYVARTCWGTGLAARLLDAAIGSAPAQLWVFEANGRARRFYEKHGFGADGNRKIDENTGVWECRYVRRGGTVGASATGVHG